MIDKEITERGLALYKKTSPMFVITLMHEFYKNSAVPDIIKSFLCRSRRSTPVEPKGRKAECHKMRFKAEYFPCYDWLILISLD